MYVQRDPLPFFRKNGKKFQVYLILVRSDAKFRRRVFSQIKQHLCCLKCWLSQDISQQPSYITSIFDDRGAYASFPMPQFLFGLTTTLCLNLILICLLSHCYEVEYAYAKRSSAIFNLYIIFVGLFRNQPIVSLY